MIIPDTSEIVFPPPQPILPIPGGLQFKDAAPMICGIVDNGVAPDDPRVLVRLNEATKIIMDYMIPVGGMAIANITPQFGILILPPTIENIIEAHPYAPGGSTAKVHGDSDVTQSWYEIVNNSTYMDPDMSHDMPLTDLGLNADPLNPSTSRAICARTQPSESTGNVSKSSKYPALRNI